MAPWQSEGGGWTCVWVNFRSWQNVKRMAMNVNKMSDILEELKKFNIIILCITFCENRGRASNAGTPSIPRHFSKPKSVMARALQRVKSKTKDIKVGWGKRKGWGSSSNERARSRHFRAASTWSKVTRFIHIVSQPQKSRHSDFDDLEIIGWSGTNHSPRIAQGCQIEPKQWTPLGPLCRLGAAATLGQHCP